VGITKEFSHTKNNITPTAKPPVRAIICVPIILRNHIIGVLYHDNKILGSSFRRSDVELLDYFAAIAAIALDNVTSREIIQKENQILTEEKEYFAKQYRSDDVIIGESGLIKEMMKRILQVAPSGSNVLILGDTGVGKELVATAIYKYSLRKDKPFICVQCSSLPDNLLPSELFGHEKGSFTGALKRRIGRFELADKGTIFLDEIGDLPHDMQVQLLRVLETRQFERIGGSETIKSDFRLIAATNRNLEKLVASGIFRKDLFYRLNVFPIKVPTLSERKDDIPLLINHFVRIYAQKLSKTFKNVQADDINMLCKYDWPGNIRELENIVERAVILNKGPHISFAGLLPAEHHMDILNDDNCMTLTDNERRHIIKALKITGWKVRGPRGAAELLDINCSTLLFRMKKLGIERPVSRK
jgi:transcriptional regulator with GAF, ATPase, and Fis domain